MTDSHHWPRGLAALALALLLALPGAAGPARADTSYTQHLCLPLAGKSIKPPSGPLVQVSGKVFLEGRDDHSGATVKINGVPVAQTDATGHYAFAWRAPTAETTVITITAECPGYLWAQTVQDTTRSLEYELPDVCLLGGDVAGSQSREVTPEAGCPSSEPVVVPGGPDGTVNVVDGTLVSRHVGVNSSDLCEGADAATPCWGPDACHPTVPHLGYRADINGDGYVDDRDLAIVYGNMGKSAPLPWLCNPQ